MLSDVDQGVLENQKPFNANDTDETKNANFREIRLLCAIHVETAPPNQKSISPSWEHHTKTTRASSAKQNPPLIETGR